MCCWRMTSSRLLFFMFMFFNCYLTLFQSYIDLPCECIHAIDLLIIMGMVVVSHVGCGFGNISRLVRSWLVISIIVSWVLLVL